MAEKPAAEIRCANCGALFSASLPRCPYCGRMNIPAAENEYLEHLEDIRSDLGDLNRLAGKQARQRFRVSLRKMLIIAAVLVLIAAAAIGLHIRSERLEAQALHAEYLWQRQAFPGLDALYDAQDWTKLEKAFREGLDADHSMYQYEHSAFCHCLMLLSDARLSLREIEDGIGDPAILLCDEAALWQIDSQYGLTEDETVILTELREPLFRDMTDRFSLTESEKETLRRSVEKNGFLPLKEAEALLRIKEVFP